MLRALVRQRFERLENAVRAGSDANRREIAPENHPVAVDDEEGAFANALVLAIGPVAARDRAFGMEVGEQRKVQVPVLGESLVRPDAVDRNSHELCAELA